MAIGDQYKSSKILSNVSAQLTMTFQQTLFVSTFYFKYRLKIVIHFLTPRIQLKTSKR